MSKWQKKLLPLCLLALCLGFYPEPANGKAGSDLFIEAFVEPRLPYLQAQVIYTARLFQPPDSRRESLIFPGTIDVVTEFLGEDDPVAVKRSGRKYEMIEYRYAVFPQRSGAIVLPGVAYSGRDLFVRGPDLMLDVQPIPASQKAGPWLPAWSLEISGSYRLPEGRLIAGDGFQRIITIEAEGLTGAHLPAPPLPVIGGLHIYRVDSSVESRIRGAGLSGRRTDRLLFVPETAGTFDIPQVTISWWNRQGDSPDVALLPGRKIVVYPAPAPVDVETPEFAGREEQRGGLESGELKSRDGERGAILPSVLFVVLLMLLTLLLIVKSRPLAGTDGLKRWRLGRRAIYGFKTACKKNDPHAAGNALLLWGRVCFSKDPPLCLGALAACLQNENAGPLLQELDRAIYGKNESPWNGEDIFKKLKTCLVPPVKKKVKPPDQALSPLIL